MGLAGPPDKGCVDELAKEFLAESLEGLDRMERCLTELELHPRDAALVGDIFRSVHTIKGTTGFLGFSRLEKLAHAGENLLGSLRDGTLTADAELISGLLQLLDGLRNILRLIETTGGEGERASDEDSSLIAELNRLNRRTGAADHSVAGADQGPGVPASSGPAPGTPVNVNDRTLRVDVDVLNRMMNLVGELVLTRNQILQSQAEHGNFAELGRRLDSVTADLRETVMQARMQPVGHLFGKYPRMVRDLARSCGKSVRIEFAGQETGLDKSLLEAIKDPLTHALRNAIDHGIEAPELRLVAGKPAEGVVSLRACHQSGYVVIELADDGAGIPIRKVVAKALERHLITEERAAAMTDGEALQLIFLPGFSTAAAVTTVSGRGVGMDVVRSNVEKAGGTVEVQSVEGRGTVLRLRVPLTLAIVPALVVRSGGQNFCLPQSALAELVYVARRDAEAVVERMGGAALYRLRDRLLPMVWLDEVLGLCEDERRREEHGFYLAVLETEGCRYGLVVDDLMAPEEIVVKPLSNVLREVGVFSGATVLGNGTLALILDVPAVAVRAGVRPVADAMAPALDSHEGDKASGTERVERPEFLIFDEGTPGRGRDRMALPLSMVERIESVPLTSVEYAGGWPMMQYRGELMPLEDNAGLLDQLREDPGGSQMATVLICRKPESAARKDGRERRVGLVVRQVLDVSAGEWMTEDAELCPERLALVRDRVTTLYGRLSTREQWRDVA